MSLRQQVILFLYWVVGMSIFATYVSSISYIGYPGKAFAADWNAFVFSLSIPIASYFAAKYFVPFYRHSGSVSAYTFPREIRGMGTSLRFGMLSANPDSTYG